MDDTTTDVQAMNINLCNMQEEMEKLSRLLHCLLQAAMLMERLERVSGDLGTVLNQLHMHSNHMQHATLRRQPTMTMQQLHEWRKAALKRHRVSEWVSSFLTAHQHIVWSTNTNTESSIKLMIKHGHRKYDKKFCLECKCPQAIRQYLEDTWRMCTMTNCLFRNSWVRNPTNALWKWHWVNEWVKGQSRPPTLKELFEDLWVANNDCWLNCVISPQEYVYVRVM